LGLAGFCLARIVASEISLFKSGRTIYCGATFDATCLEDRLTRHRTKLGTRPHGARPERLRKFRVAFSIFAGAPRSSIGGLPAAARGNTIRAPQKTEPAVTSVNGRQSYGARRKVVGK
jgi:hypothetical protein